MLYDPRLKSRVKKAVMDFLYSLQKENYETTLSTIITRNTHFIHSAHESFIYKGQFYSNVRTARPVRYNQLLPEFRPVMDKLLADHKILMQDEYPRVESTVGSALNASYDLNNVYLLLPACVHSVVRQEIGAYQFDPDPIPSEKITYFLQQHDAAINLMCQRMALNLLLV